MGIVCDNDDPTSKPTFESDKINGINLEASIPQKEVWVYGFLFTEINFLQVIITISEKICLPTLFFQFFFLQIKKTVLSMEPSDACSLLEMLIAGWHSRSGFANAIFHYLNVLEYNNPNLCYPSKQRRGIPT